MVDPPISQQIALTKVVMISLEIITYTHDHFYVSLRGYVDTFVRAQKRLTFIETNARGSSGCRNEMFGDWKFESRLYFIQDAVK